MGRRVTSKYRLHLQKAERCLPEAPLPAQIRAGVSEYSQHVPGPESKKAWLEFSTSKTYACTNILSHSETLQFKMKQPLAETNELLQNHRAWLVILLHACEKGDVSYAVQKKLLGLVAWISRDLSQCTTGDHSDFAAAV
jgi:hypothetical protein